MAESVQPDQRVPERVPSKRRSWSWKKRAAIFGTVLVLLVICYFVLPPVYGQLKLARADQFFDQGQEFYAKGLWTNALDRFELALQMDPGRGRFRSALARASEKISVEQGLRSWVEILRSPEITASERQDFVEFVLGLGRMDIAGKQIEILMRRRPPEPRTLALAASFFRMQGDLDQALVYSKGAFFSSPNDDKIQFQYASLLMQADTGEEKEEGRKLMWELSGRQGDHQVDAWRRLVVEGNLKPAEARQIGTWLEASPALSTNAVLRANLLWATDAAVESRRDALIRETIARTSLTNDYAFQELVIWLNYRKAFDSTLQLVDDVRMGTNLFLFTSRLEALTGLKKWEMAESLLLRTNVPVEPVFQLGMRAYLKSLRGDTAGEKQLWNAALEESSKNFNKARSIANLAERIGRNDIALRAFAPYLNPPTPAAVQIEANRQSYRIHRSQGNLKSARDSLLKIVTGQRVDERTQVDFYYLNLLLGEQVRPTLEECLRELRGKPDRHNFRILAALAHVRLGDGAAGLQMIQGLPVNPKLLSAPWRAIAMTVYRANGKVAEWTQLSETLSNSGFSKTELQMLNSIGAK